MKHSEIVLKIQKAHENKTRSHAYLFYGAQNAQLEALSLEIAAKIQCKNGGCMTCIRCQRILNKQYIDLVYLDLASEKLKKESVLQLKKQFAQKPVEGQLKVYIITNVFNATTHALNSLLKFLEEPTGEVLALLSCPNIGRGMETIISRCTLQQVEGYSVEQLVEMTNHQEHQYVELMVQVTKDAEVSSWFINQELLTAFIEQFQLLLTNKANQTSIILQEVFFQQLQDKRWIELLCDLLLFTIRHQETDALKNLYEGRVTYQLQDVEVISRLRSELAQNINKAMIIDQLMAL